LGVLYVGQGGIGGGPGQPRQLALPVAPPTLSRWATRAIAIVVAAIALTLAGAGLALHSTKVHGRQAEAACMQGFRKLAEGSAGEAVPLFDRAIALKARFTEAFDGRGNALQAVGRSLEAVASYRSALEIEARYFPSRLGLATALAALGR